MVTRVTTNDTTFRSEWLFSVLIQQQTVVKRTDERSNIGGKKPVAVSSDRFEKSCLDCQ